MKPGIYKNTNAEYHSGPGLSSSGVKELLKSARHFKQAMESPQDVTPEMIKGSLVHAMVLEPEIMNREFAVCTFNIRRGKEYDKGVADNPEKTVVSTQEFEEASLIKEAFDKELKENAHLANLMPGHKELSAYWIDPGTGALCKCRPDNICSNQIEIINPTTKEKELHWAIMDLKTTRDASLDAFQKQVVDLKYFVSAAWYLEGVRQCQGFEIGSGKVGDVGIPTKFTLVAIENKAPYALQIFTFSDKAIEMGARLCYEALETYSNAVATDTWEGYPRQNIELDLPSWALWKLNKK